MNDAKLQEVIGRALDDHTLLRKVADEHTLLKVKIQKLGDFLDAPSGYLNELHAAQRHLLVIQIGIMKSYLTVLALRLDNLNGVEL